MMRFCLLVFFLVNLSLGQRTNMRACECEYTVNGKCAYTLLLPASQQGQPTCPSQGNNKQVDTLQNNFEQLQTNLSSLSRWNGEQAQMLSQLQSLLLSQQSKLDIVSQKADKTNDKCQNCEITGDQIFEQGHILQQLVSTVSEQNSTLLELKAGVQALVEGLITTNNKVSTLVQSRDIMQRDLQNINRRVNQLRSKFHVCSARGLLVSGPGNNNIGNDQISASSELDASTPAVAARIFVDDTKNISGAWCSAEPNKKQEWLQFDLGSPRIIFGIITKGRADFGQWVTSYNIYFKESGGQGDFTPYKDVLGQVETFVGNHDKNTPQVNMLWQPIIARFIRIIPLTSGAANLNKCMRADIIGCLDV